MSSSQKKQTDKTFQTLFAKAKRYLDHAHSPYSKVRVAAAVLTSDGKIYGGCNVENASYGGTICAERVAITKAVSEGSRKIKALLVVTNQAAIWPPCGLCRQVIAEFAKDNVPVYCADLKKNYVKKKFGDIFPGAFSPDYLITK